MFNFNFSEKVDDIVADALKATKLEDTPQNRRLVLQGAYDGLKKDLDSTSSSMEKNFLLEYLQTIEGKMGDIRYNTTK